jgi:DNA-binding response OmpR family regulator
VDQRRVLVVDDEQPLARIVGSYLQVEGFTVDLAHDGPSAVEAARAGDPDLVVLDVMMPGFDGIEACRQIRAFSDCYIIMLTARDEEIDKVVGLAVGADDYLVKPFSPRELVARVRAMLRRPRTRPATQEPAGAERLAAAGLIVDTMSRKAWRSSDELELDLTRTEFDLLAALAASPRRAFTRRQLIDDVWGADWYGDEHIVDVHIGHLRRKLGDSAADPTFIRTVRGVGYGMARP